MCSNPEDSSPIGLNSAPPPPMLSYEDDSGTLCEIFVPSGRYEEALRLHEKQDWKVLSEFPRWSDCPPPPPRDPDSMIYTPKGSEGDAKRRIIYLPQGTAERATLLLVNEDWAALENEFEIYSGQADVRPEVENEEGQGGSSSFSAIREMIACKQTLRGSVLREEERLVDRSARS